MATDWGRLTVIDLRQELKRRGLPQTGKKADLIERLTEAENEGSAEEEQSVAQTDDAPNDSPEHDDNNNNKEQQPDSSLITQPTETPIAPQQGAPSPKKDSSVGDDANLADKPPSTTKDSPSDKAPAIYDQSGEAAPAESALTAPEVSQDSKSRKRRSRSPPPDDEVSRKRTRPSSSHDDDRDLNGISASPYEEATPLRDSVVGKDVSYAVLQPDIPEPHPKPDSPVSAHAGAIDQPAKRDASAPIEEPEHKKMDYRERYSEPRDDPMDEDTRDVAPAEHPATAALYIRNFMRPLRESMLRGYLLELSAPRGGAPDPDAVVDFFLDQIRTHAFVRFSSVAAASRVRMALHGEVWPNERERKELWVDFIPPEMVREWAEREQTEGTRGTRWEVRYDFDDDGNTTVRLVNAEAEPARQPTRSVQAPPASATAPSVPSGPSRPFAGIEGAPLGPRGRGGAAFRQQSFPTVGGDWRETRTLPVLLYQPVSEELAQRRVDNMRSFYTTDRHRDMGRPDEINRYTFENQDAFVDRGKEVFIGIRPPHRERERRRDGGGRGPPRGPPPSYPPRSDRYFGGSGGGGRRDEPARGGGDAPRSRLDGAPLPTFNSYRSGGGWGGGGGGGGGGRRDGFRGGRW